MPLSEMGSAPALLSVANQAAETQQRGKIAEEENNQKAIENAQQMPNKMADQALERNMQMIEITPQLASGAKNATGDDSWDRAVGTKMDARVYSSLLQYGSNKKLANRMFWGGDGMYMYNEQTGEAHKIPGSEGRDESGLKKIQETYKAKGSEDDARHKNKMDEIDEAGKFKGKGGRGSGASQDPKDKEFLKTYRSYQKDTSGFNQVLLAQLAKQHPEQAKELQDKQVFLQKNKDRFDKLQGVGGQGGDQPDPQAQAGKNAKAIDWLKKKYPKLTNPTEHDIEWALGQMGNG